MNGLNDTSLDTLCSALAKIMGIPAPEDLNIMHLYKAYPKR